MIEFKTPGFGIPGTVGLIALALLTYGHHMVGLAEVWEIALILVGLALIAVEIFLIPGTFVAAIAGTICVLVGLVLSLQDFTFPDVSAKPWQVSIFLESIGRVLVSALGAALALLAFGRFLDKVPGASKLVLQTAIAGSAPAPEVSADLVCRHGHAVTQLRPGGKIDIDGEVFDVVAEGDFVAIGEPVEVLSVDGMKTLVGKVKR